jgi:pimeloyl-ACP methyl ester carboxylesterase
MRSGRPSLEFIAEEAAGGFPALLHADGLERFALFGHSVGGAMALAIAAAQRDLCEAVITESAQAFVEGRTLEGIRAGEAQFEDPAQFQKLVRWHGEKAHWVLDAWTGVWLSPGFRSWSLDEVLPQVRCPVLAIHGDSDEFGSLEFPRRIAARAGGPAQLAILSPCGHVPHRERREEVLRLGAAFLANEPVSGDRRPTGPSTPGP